MRLLGITLLTLLALLPASTTHAQNAPAPGFRHEPMIFFVAKGEPNACGPGCSTWIAAEGTFDPDVNTRLVNFLSVAGRQRLPIFFHSPGGELQPSVAVGQLLREKRMTAGIGQTIPEGCREGTKANAACRKLMQRGGELRAQLRVRSGICASGCAYALVGASVRLIGPGARLGVHASRLVPRPTAGVRDPERVSAAARDAAESQSYDLLRHYVALAGIDPVLIDVAVKTPHNRVHWLTREELVRYGIVSGDQYETRWFRLARPGGSFLIVKSVTQPSQFNREENRTTNIGIDCVMGSRTFVTLRRELSAKEQVGATNLTLSAGDAFLLVFTAGRRQNDTLELRVQPVAPDALARAAAADNLVFRETGESWSRETKLSTKGLAEALSAIPARCGGRA